MSNEWKTIPFTDAVADASGGNEKTKQKEYEETGQYPIVDQGKSLVGGYTNDPSRLCKAELPVVVFGDHTRCLKYVDFPFCMGADGVKVLRPKVDLDVKYLYEYLDHLRLPSHGYDRHFKYLKRFDVSFPPLLEQKRIAEILDRAEALRAKRRAALALLDELTQSIFLDMFGDPVSNPMGWPVAKLSELCETTQGVQIPRSDQLEEPAAGYRRYLYINDFYAGDSLKFIKDEYPTKVVTNRDLVMANTGSPGRVFKGRDGILSNNLFRISFDNTTLSTLFFYHFLSSNRFQNHLQGQMKKGIQSHLGHKTFGIQKLPLPPIERQKEFEQRLVQLENVNDLQRASVAELDLLFASLQHRAFRGELSSAENEGTR